MALITDFLKVSDALKKSREGTFDLMDARFDRFVTQSDGLRDMYLNNQRLPEELSKTRLNDFNNRFDLQNRQNNRETLLETARLNAQFGLNDSRFNNENQGLTQERDRLGIQSDILTRKNSILEAEAKRELAELTAGNPINPETDIIDYHDNLLRRARTPEAKEAIRKKVVTEYKPELDFMSSIPDAFNQTFTGTEASILAKQKVLKNKIEQSIKNGTFGTLQRLYESGYMDRNQRIQYESMIGILTTAEDGPLYTIEALTGQEVTPVSDTGTPSAVAPITTTDIAPATQPTPLPLPEGVSPVLEQVVPNASAEPQAGNPVLPVVQEPDLFTPPDVANTPDIDDNIAIINETNSIDVESLKYGDLEQVSSELTDYMDTEEFVNSMPITKEKVESKLNEVAEKQMDITNQIQSLEESIVSDRELINNLTLTHARNNPSDPDISTSKNPHTSLLMKQLQTSLDRRLKRLKELEDFVAGVEVENVDPTANPHPDLFDSGVVENEAELTFPELELDQLELGIQNNEPIYLTELEPAVSEVLKEIYAPDVLRMMAESKYAEQREQAIAFARQQVNKR